MAEVKWIKIVTDVFDDEKILMIESMPEADSIIVIWFKLLCLAGKQNNSGVFQLGQMPYTDEMFSTIFRRPLNTIRLALKTFEQFSMIEIINHTVTIPNWEKHQAIDKLDEIREQTRKRVAKHRDKQKLLTTSNVTSNATVTHCNALDKKRLEEDKKESRLEGELLEDSAPPKPTKHKYGAYKNVLFTDEEYQNLQEEFPHDYSERIERLSEYIASTGKTYKNYLATIRTWARKDKERTNPSKGSNSNPFLDMLREEGGI
jgi:predicted phage replisome organizer